MNTPNAVHGPVAALASAPQRDPDDFDFEAWFKDQRLPMEFGPAREARLTRWFEAHGFVDVQIKYRPKADKFRLIMRLRDAAICRSDDEAEDWLRRGAEACGSEAEQVIGLATQDGKVLGSFKLSLPQATWRAEIGR